MVVMDKTPISVSNFSARILIPTLLVLTIGVVPISSTGKGLFLLLASLAIVLTPSYCRYLCWVVKRDWAWAALLMFILSIVACLWSPATPHNQFFVVEKYCKVMFLSVMVIGFHKERTRHYALQAFLLAMLLTCSISILKDLGFLDAFNIDPDRVFRNHIMTGFMVAFAAYLSAWLAYRQTRGGLRALYILLTLVYTYHTLFVNHGRTGYIIYLLLALLLLTQLCSWRQALAGAALVSLVFGLSYFQIPQMRTGLSSIIEQVHAYHHNEKDSSVGLRLQFHDFARDLFVRHPFAGNGTASFQYYFHMENPVPSWGHDLWEPHSQYWLMASEFGLLGIAAMAFFLISLFTTSLRLQTMRVPALGMLLPFTIGNLSDSLLFYSGSGYIFIIFMGICLGEQLETWDFSSKK